MVIVDQSADPNEQLYLNIDTITTPSRFTAVIREDICLPSEPIQINPEKVVNVGVCLEQPTLVILVDVKGYHGKAKIQLIGAILQLIQPFPNHRISIHLGGTVSPKRPSIELDSATPTEVFKQVVSAFKSLNGYNKNFAEDFPREINEVYADKVLMGGYDVIMAILTTVDRVHLMKKVQLETQPSGTPREIFTGTNQLLILDKCEPECYENMEQDINSRINLPKEFKVNFVSKFTWMARMRQFTLETCSHTTQQALDTQSVCAKYDRSPLKVIFYVDTSINTSLYQLKFYTAVIQMVLKQLSSVHLTSTGRNEIVIKKFTRRGNYKNV